MKRLFQGLIVLGVLACIAIFVLHSRLPGMVSSDLTKRFKVPSSVEDISIGFSSIEIDELEIANVPGGKLPKALSVGQIKSKAPITNYLKEKIVIEEISLEEIYLGLEFNSSSGTKGNWTELMNNLEATAEPTNPKKEESQRDLLIKRLVLKDIQVEVYYKNNKTTRKLKPIDEIVLTNISSENGFPTDQIMHSVLGQMLKSVFVQENLNNMLDDLLNDPESSGNGILEPLKGLFK